MSLLFILILFVVSVLPGVLVFISARKSRMLAEQERRIASAVLRMENIMYDAVIKDGSICHDVIYKVMCNVQHSRDYGVQISLGSYLKHLKDGQGKDILSIKEEIESSSPDVFDAISEFFSAYTLAAFYKRPIRFVVALFFFIGGLKILIFALRRRLEISTIKRKLRDQYVSQSISTNSKLA